MDGQAGEGDGGAESTLTTILQIKKLGREIDCEGILRALLQEGENMGKPENGPAALQSMDNDVRPLTPSRSQLREGVDGSIVQ